MMAGIEMVLTMAKNINASHKESNEPLILLASKTYNDFPQIAS
jgi:hypothetical protein